MNQPNHENLLHELFRSAVNSTATEGPHFIDDDELLISWSVGELDQEQHEELIAHMAVCSYCRSEVAAMVKAGALVLPEVEEASETHVVSPANNQKRKSKWAVWSVVAAAAAVMMLTVNQTFFMLLPTEGPLPSLMLRPTEGPLDVARKQLEAGDHQAALASLETVLDEKKLTGELQAEAESMLQQAGYQLALGHLDRQEYEDVAAVESRVTRRVGMSPRLWNLKIQAERVMPDEFALAMSDTLLDHGFNLDGTPIIKSFPTFDEESERLGKQYAQAVADYPQNGELRLNYGHFLQEQRQLKQAQEQFLAALKLEPGDALAQLSLGLVAFELKQYDDALKQFEAVLQQDSDDAQAHINVAMALEKLNKSAEAREHWLQAAKLSTDKDLQKQIRDLLSPSE